MTSVAWHPSGDVIACGSTDFTCRVLSARLLAGGEPGAEASKQFGALPDFGTEMMEWETDRVRDGGFARKLYRRRTAHTFVFTRSTYVSYTPMLLQSWVNDVAWSPSGLQLAFVCHDCSLHIVTFSPSGEAAPTKVALKTEGLPALRLLWLSERSIVTAGNNAFPDVFALNDSGQWVYVGACDQRASLSAASGHASSSSTASSFGSAKAMFAARAAGTAGSGSSSNGSKSTSASADDKDRSRHEGVITYLQPAAVSGGFRHSSCNH